MSTVTICYCKHDHTKVVMPEDLLVVPIPEDWRACREGCRWEPEASRNLEVDSLLSLVPYLLPKYTNTTVTFLSQEKNPNEENPQVEGQLARRLCRSNAKWAGR